MTSIFEQKISVSHPILIVRAINDISPLLMNPIIKQFNQARSGLVNHLLCPTKTTTAATTTATTNAWTLAYI